MIHLRRHRCRIGLFLAAMLFAAAGLPGVLSAAQGMQLQTPICGPGAAEFPTAPGPAADSHNDHCKIFPCGATLAHDGRSGQGLCVANTTQVVAIPVPLDAGNTAFRAELSPLNGRAPPSQS